jgi:Uma2 family endonuclease
MTVTAPGFTAEQLSRLPKDGFRYELVRGELRKMPPAGDEHGDVAMRIGWRLARHVEANSLGKVYAAETGFLLETDPDTVRAPDAAFVRRERIEATGTVAGFRRGAPDLVVEVVSPGDTHSEVEEKAMEWLRAGSGVVLTVYRSLHEITLLTEEETLDLGDVLPGWTCPVRDLFG